MLTAILTFLGSLVSGPFLTAASNLITAKYKAQVDQGKITADEAVRLSQIDAQREALEQQTVNTEQGKWFPFVRWGFAFPFILFNLKIIIWDRMLHLGFTEPLSADLIGLEQVIVAAYFGHSAIQMLATTVLKGKT